MRQGVGFIIVVILARLLSPEDFGTLALLALFLGIAGLFVNAGFSAALIQTQDTTHIDESTVFWFNIGAAVIMTLVLFAISPLIADFFALPVLKPLTMLMACNILISAMGSIHSTLLSKRLDFKTPMKIGVASMTISGCVGVYMAWADYGVWALAGQAVSSTVVNTVMLWVFSPWRPLFTFSAESYRRLVGFGGWLFASWLVDTLYQRGYTLLIGKFYGAYDLGIYNRADDTQQLPVNLLARVLQRVSFPLFSSVSQDKEQLRRGVRLTVRSLMLVTAPAMLGLGVLAEPFIGVVFGDQWLPAAPILQVLCVAGMLFPLNVINLNVLQAQGHAKHYFRLEVIKKSTGTALLVVGSVYGVMGIAWSRVIQSVVALWINGYYTNKYLKYGFFQQIRDVMSSIILSVFMAAIVWVAGDWFLFDGVIKLILLIGLGAIVFIMSNIIFQSGPFKEALAFVRGKALP